MITAIASALTTLVLIRWTRRPLLDLQFNVTDVVVMDITPILVVLPKKLRNLLVPRKKPKPNIAQVPSHLTNMNQMTMMKAIWWLHLMMSRREMGVAGWTVNKYTPIGRNQFNASCRGRPLASPCSRPPKSSRG
jgi:hypothetical protein